MPGDSRNILLMTATIDPVSSPELARVDPELRLRDYQRSFDHYLGEIGKSIDAIVFGENSDSDIGSLRDMAAARGLSDKVEFVANFGRESFPTHDRSYGEFRLVDRIMQNSRLVAEADENVTIWKITGRYIVLNLGRMIRTAPREFDLYCDLRSHPMKWMDLRFMAWSMTGYRKVMAGVADKLGVDPREPVMRGYIPEQADLIRLVPRFRREPLVDGIRGWDNRHYLRASGKIKFILRALARRIAPFYWI